MGGDRANIVIVGSGIGGMAAGALFAEQGLTVRVLEQHPELIGGHGRCLCINGLEFSMGPQYVWDFGSGQPGDRFLDFLGIKEANPFIPMQADGFERIFVGERHEPAAPFLDFCVPLGLENFRRRMEALFPSEKRRIGALFSDMAGIYKAYTRYLRTCGQPPNRFLQAGRLLLAKDIAAELKLRFGLSVFLSLRAFFDKYGISPLLRRILYGHGGIFAESESEMSAIAYIIGTGNYHAGARYPANGFSRFFDSLKNKILETGGSVETGKRVVRLESQNSRVTGAVCADRSFYGCDWLLSDISPRLTWRLLGENKAAKAFTYSPSHCICTCCIGLRPGFAGLRRMQGRNYWWQDGREVNYHDPDITSRPQMLFINSPTAGGFGRVSDSAGDALLAYCPGNYFQEKRLAAKGPQALQRFKRRLAEEIIDILEQNIFAGIRPYLMFAVVISAVDVEAATCGELANAYGRRLSAGEIRKGPIRERGRPDNLYNVSAVKNSPGIAGGIASAAEVFAELTGRRL
ncbi:MAG: NAD(P)-binding protein [Desulfosalsimonadaceae bacterium]